MADEGSSSRHDTEDGTNLTRAQSALEQRVESLTAEFQRFAAEMRREIRSIKGSQTPTATTPVVHGNVQSRSDVHLPGREMTRSNQFDNTRFGDGLHNSRYAPLESESEDERNPFEADTYGLVHSGRNHHGGSCFEPRSKLEVPTFHGHLHIEDYLDWEQSVESFFDYMEISPE